MHSEPDRVLTLRAARQRILERIADACSRAHRDPAQVSLLAVSKTFGPEVLRDAVTAGITAFGENRVQEAVAKAPEVPGASWHLVGPLQANKVRKALEVFGVIQTVDSVELAERVHRIAGEVRPLEPLAVLLQVNVDDDPAKAGFAPDALPAVLGRIAGLGRLRIDGLMTIGRLVASPEAARPTFRRLRTIAGELRASGAPLGPELSMGMSDDFEIAIEEGATIVRIGRALFGAREVEPHDHGPTTPDHRHG